MIWQVWADIALGASVPLATGALYFAGRIEQRHVWMMAWGFAVGSTWEFPNYFFGETYHTIRTPWPMPLITLNLWHAFWDAGLFIVGYWLCLWILRTPDCATRFRGAELLIMWLWGVVQEFVVELLGNGVIWEYHVLDWNPVWLTIGGQNYTLVPQLIWAIAPVVYYLGVIRINRFAASSHA